MIQKIMTESFTAQQIKALRFLSTVETASPSEIGRAIGGTGNLGRTGGNVAGWLVRKGVAVNTGHLTYGINTAGLQVLKELNKC